MTFNDHTSIVHHCRLGHTDHSVTAFYKCIIYMWVYSYIKLRHRKVNNLGHTEPDQESFRLSQMKQSLSEVGLVVANC